MIKNINNFLDKYNISINIVNDILYLDIQNHINNTKFNLIVNHNDLILLDINNIDILHLYLQKCFVKAKNYNICFYEHSTELIIEVSYIDDDEYIEKKFKLYAKYYNDYYEKIIEKQDMDEKLQNQEITNNNCNINSIIDIQDNYLINTLYEYFYNIAYVLKILCIDDEI